MGRMFFLTATLVASLVAVAHAQHGLPGDARLAEMGLSGIRILSDAEALQVRVSGYRPNRWGDLYPFVHGVSRLVRQQPIRQRSFLLNSTTVARWL